MEDRFAIARVDVDGDPRYLNVVMGDGFVSADEAQTAAVDFYRNTGVECYPVRLVPLPMDKKSSLQIIREQTAATASQVTTINTRTEQIYRELQEVRASMAPVAP